MVTVVASVLSSFSPLLGFSFIHFLGSNLQVHTRMTWGEGQEAGSSERAKQVKESGLQTPLLSNFFHETPSSQRCNNPPSLAAWWQIWERSPIWRHWSFLVSGSLREQNPAGRYSQNIHLLKIRLVKGWEDSLGNLVGLYGEGSKCRH